MATLCDIHIAWVDQPHEDRLHLNEYLRHHSVIFSTNYDLLLYWAIMAKNGDKAFRDFFWSPPGARFDPSNTRVSGNAILVYYLHGGIHLYSFGGMAHKRISTPPGNILDAATDPNAHPALFVSEGTPYEKMAAIQRSDYLRFAFSAFEASSSTPIIVFGHAFGDQDEHIADAIASPGREVAVSVRRDTSKRELGRLQALFVDCNLTLFWSDTHPLGLSTLAVT